MRRKSILKRTQERVTSLLNENNKRISIRTKIFLFVGLFIILNIFLNLLIVKVSINNIYLGMEKRELSKQYNLIKKNISDEETLTNIIYDASDNGIKIKILDSNLNMIYTIFNDRMSDRFTNLDLMLLNSLDSHQSKIITLKNYKNNGYDLHLVGKINEGYVILSSSIESLKKDAKTTIVVMVLTSIITFGILIIISYFISKLFGKKINEVKEVTDDIANLKFGKKIEIKSNDELGDLFENINLMSSKLEESITNLEEANEKLKQDLAYKEKQEIARKKLIANISHEFKTPLTIISGYGQLLREEIKGKENKENVDLMISEAQRLGELVKEFLELSKLESDNMVLNKENVDVKKIIEDNLKKQNILILSNKIKIETNYNDNQNILVDKKQFNRVVENILTNAIKFCKNDKIIRIRTYIKDNYFYYEVFNTGDNIKNTDLDNIFNSYYKDKSERNKEGTGLGLTIVNAIAKLHDGSCKVENREDGVCFWVRFKI